ncbi:hypothetical protein D1820_16900 [Phaeobacter sp. LSS9]|uniref:hypothetical protein n=1 Tax=unclassified Phaeobacter TaxID=2621772 RepID=UPI000E532448|nr:hypothetical protein [Phaeobacter sp. LSS9]AXT36526.1 hypothetical protein D1820_16900 [Phaeobacter sp. LSS9]
MGKYDKDRFQKELSIRFCLSRKMVPFLEVVTSSSADLSDNAEVLTDLDVAGVEIAGDGGLRWAFFDCKSGKMSAINRAFWAAGVKDYVDFDKAYVLLKNKPVHNQRLSALTMNVDLHYEDSFRELGTTNDQAFADDLFYQSSVDRWERVFDAYAKYSWSKATFELARNSVPLTKTPWTTFRWIVAELRNVRGEYDPKKPEHKAIYLDLMASAMVLWASLSRDIRRFYEPAMSKDEFEKILRYYLWGGRENYEIRQKMKVLSGDGTGQADMPAWSKLIAYAGITVAAPNCVLECAHICRELSIRCLAEENDDFDKRIKLRMSENNRIRQFVSGMNGYLIDAGALPKDMAKTIDDLLFGF